jgi:hypothetical protein
MESGGSVVYDYEVHENGDPVHDAEPHGPVWLHDLTGIDISRMSSQSTSTKRKSVM